MYINIGSETVNQFYNAGLIKNVADLYELKTADILKLDRWAEKSANNFIESVSESRSVPYDRTLYALGIRYVGETVARRLAQAFHSIADLMNSTYEQLIAVGEIGEVIARSVLDYFSIETNRLLIERLKNHGVQFELSEDELAEKSNKLNERTFVISGTFALHSRDDYKVLIEKNGGKNTGSVSGKTDYILAGDNMGPAKLEKAMKMGIKIISEVEFLKMIE
jgi:DNA ligase (NAD+)